MFLNAQFFRVLGVASLVTFTTGALSSLMTNANKGFHVYSIEYGQASDIPDIPEASHGYLIQMSTGWTYVQIYSNLLNDMFFRKKAGDGVVTKWQKVNVTEWSF